MIKSGNPEDKLELYLERLKQQGLPENFCPIPFTSLILHPTGNVGCCREKGTQHSVGHIDQQTIPEIWNSEKLQSWRKEFLTGNIETCKNEIAQSSCHRLFLNRKLFDFLKHPPQEIMEGPILRLSPDLNGKCNLQCPFCFVWKMPNGKYDEVPGFWDNMKENVFPFVVQVDPLGGEPFVQQDLYKTIDMISEVNPQATWTFTTNGHWKFSHFIKEKLDKIHIHTISFSIDSIDPENYQVVRKGGSLDVVLKNLDDIINYEQHRRRLDRGFLIILNATFQQQNWHEVGPLIRYAKEKGIFPFVQFVFEPEPLSMLTLSEDEKKKRLNFYLSDLSDEEIMIAHRVLRPLINGLDVQEKKKAMALCDGLTQGKFSKI
jgi:radical SAM protein with 4Fe4S-binding SPASM domain